MIEHRPGNWQQTVDEVEAVHRIDAAIGEIKKASIEVCTGFAGKSLWAYRWRHCGRKKSDPSIKRNATKRERATKVALS